MEFLEGKSLINGSSEQNYITEWNESRIYRNLVCSSISLIVNIFTLITLCRTHKLGPRIRVMLLSMTLNDIIFSFVTILCTSLPFDTVMHTYLCYVWITISGFVYLNSCFCIMVITIDRVLALYCPLFYHLHATLNKTVIAVAGCWLLAATLIIVTMWPSAHRQWELFVPCVALEVGPGFFSVSLAVLALVCVFVVAVMHLLIWIKIWRRQRRVSPAPAHAKLCRSRSHQRLCLRPVHEELEIKNVEQALKHSGNIIIPRAAGPAVVLHHAGQTSKDVLFNVDHGPVAEDPKEDANTIIQTSTGDDTNFLVKKNSWLSCKGQAYNTKDDPDSFTFKEHVLCDGEMDTSTDKERITESRAGLSRTKTAWISTERQVSGVKSTDFDQFIEPLSSHFGERVTENCAKFSSSEVDVKVSDALKDITNDSDLYPDRVQCAAKTEVSDSRPKEEIIEAHNAEDQKEQKTRQWDIVTSFTSRNTSTSEQKIRQGDDSMHSVTNQNPNPKEQNVCQNDISFISKQQTPYTPNKPKTGQNEIAISTITHPTTLPCCSEGSAIRSRSSTNAATVGSLCNSASETISAVSSITIYSNCAATPSDIPAHQLPDPAQRTQRLCCCICSVNNCSLSAHRDGADDNHARQRRRGRKTRSEAAAFSSSCTTVAGRAGALALALTAMFMAAHFPMAVYFVWASYKKVLLYFPTDNNTLYYAILVNSIEGIMRPLIYFWRVVGCERIRKVCGFVCKTK